MKEGGGGGGGDCGMIFLGPGEGLPRYGYWAWCVSLRRACGLDYARAGYLRGLLCRGRMVLGVEEMGPRNRDRDGWCRDGLTLDGEVVTYMGMGEGGMGACIRDSC